jgi:hypothetical protein
VEPPGVAFGDLTRDEQPEAETVGLRGHKRMEQLIVNR